MDADPHRLARLLVEPPRPAAIRDSPHAHWWVVGTVCIGAFMGQLDASIVTLAFPTLREDFHASLGAVEWVALAYLLTLVAAVTAVGRFADMVGRKLLYTYGFGLFTLASAACALAPSLLALDGFRVLQALGAAMLQANSVALIATAMPPGRLGRGIGVQGAAQAVGLALGPSVGGLLIGLGGWRLVFLVSVPAGVVGMVAGWFLLPRSRELAPRARFDWLGLALFVPAVCALLFALSHGPLLLLATAIVLGAGFVVRERRAAAPMLDLALFGRVPFSAGVSAGLLSYLVLFGVLFVSPFYLEAHGSSPAQAGLVLTALPVALGLVAPFAGRLADRVGARPPTVAGMVLAAAAFAAIAVWRPAAGGLAVAVAVVGVGLGAFTPANNAAIMAAAPRRQSGVAGGVLNMTRGIGTSLGVAATGAVFAAAQPDVAHGFRIALLFLAVLSLAAAAVAGLRGRGEVDRTRPVAVE